MKFGKSLMRVVETSDPEWGPYWINYKFLKRKINEIVEDKGGVRVTDQTRVRNPEELSKSSREIEFFRQLRSELKKSSDFFASTEAIYRIRKERIWEAFKMLEDQEVIQDKNTWTRLLMACVKFYKDVLLIENFAIMNYCGFSKILKKHDKMTGFVTREAFMRNVMNHQNFTHYPYIMELIKEAEVLFGNIQKMESVMPLQDEERLFIAAMRDLNHQASRMQAEEKHGGGGGGTGSSLSGDDENDQYQDQDQSNDDNDSDASTRSPSSPAAQYLSAAMGPHVVPHSYDSGVKTVTEDCVSLSLPARLPLPTHMPQMPANAMAAAAASVPARPSASASVADAIAAATASVVDAALRLSTACPPGPHTHACGSGTTTYATSTTATITIDSTSMINSDGPVAPGREGGKEGRHEHLSVSEGVREEEGTRPLKRSAVDAGLI